MSIKLNTRCVLHDRVIAVRLFFFVIINDVDSKNVETRLFVEFYILILVRLYIEFQIRSRNPNI